MVTKGGLKVGRNESRTRIMGTFSVRRLLIIKVYRSLMAVGSKALVLHLYFITVCNFLTICTYFIIAVSIIRMIQGSSAYQMWKNIILTTRTFTKMNHIVQEDIENILLLNVHVRLSSVYERRLISNFRFHIHVK